MLVIWFVAVVVCLWTLLQFGFFGALIMLPSLQRKAIYNCKSSKVYANGPQEPPSRFGFKSLSIDGDGQEVPLKLKTTDGLEIEAWHIKSIDTSPGNSKDYPFFIYFHGNASNRTKPRKLQIYEQLLRCFPGSQILAPEYRGYAMSDDEPTQQGVSLDARAAWEYVTKIRGVLPTQIVIIGQSLGAAVATHLLKELNDEGVVPRATILYCGFKNVPEVSIDYPKMKYAMPIVSVLPRIAEKISPYIHDKWNSIEIVRGGLQGPLLWLHGTKDRTIPYSHGKALFGAALQMRGATKRDQAYEFVDTGKIKMSVWQKHQLGFIKIPGGGHDDMGERPEIFEALRTFLDLL